MKILPVGRSLFRADRQSDMTNLIVTFQNFSNAPKKSAKHRVKRTDQT